MSWVIYYRIRCDRDWTDSDRRRLREHMEKWNSQLSALSEPYGVGGMIGRGEFHGTTKAAPSASAAADDYVTIVQALRELEALFPGAQVQVSDDSGIQDETRPGDIDLDALRGAMAEVWGEGEGAGSSEGLEEQELEALRQAAELERAREEARPLLEKAAKDFEIWKRAQQKKQGGN